MTSETYGRCHRCGEEIVPRVQDHEYSVRGRIIMVFENVPVGVCAGCGEKVLKGAVAQRMEAMALKRVSPGKARFIPVVSL